jgi:hypothetical protein
MTVLIQLEHPVRDFDTWKAAFDRDPINRRAGGVRRYRILRPVDDPAYVAVDLEFKDRSEADAFLEALHRLWQSPVAQAALAGTPRARIVEATETVTLRDPSSSDLPA